VNILTQDRKSIYPMTYCHVSKKEGRNCYDLESDIGIIASYKTEEEAIRILNELFEAVGCCNPTYKMPGYL
jgi:hypothetical protein